MHEDQVLEPRALDLLRSLARLPELADFVLVGGTALALQIGHRKSDDLDFFTRVEFEPDALLQAVETIAAVDVSGIAPNALSLLANGVKVDLIRFNYPLLRPAIEEDGYRLLDLPDIAAMKLSAIANRGSKKDFFDIHFLLDRFSLQQLLGFYREKFQREEVFFVLKSLVYFADAEVQPNPAMLEAVTWSQVKQRIAAEIEAEA